MITVTPGSQSQPGGCADHSHDHSHDHTRRAVLAAAAALAETVPHLPRKVRVFAVPGGRWAWCCSLCAPPVAGSVRDPAAAWAHVAHHMSRRKYHHRWVAAHLGGQIGRENSQ
jgi:hypothetical protein